MRGAGSKALQVTRLSYRTKNLFQPQNIPLVVAGAAAWLILAFFTQQHHRVLLSQAVRVGSQVATVYAYRMDFGDILRDSQQVWHGAERLAPKIHIQPSNNDPDTAQG